MNVTSMPCDQTIAEVALAWLHLPSGAAVLQGVVQHPDGGPIIGGAVIRDRPLKAGGSQVLIEGADPAVSRFTAHPDTWAMTGPEPVQELLELRGWRTITRVETVAILRLLGYQLRPSATPGHVIHADQGDEQIWHHKLRLNGRACRYTLATFAVRPALPSPTNPWFEQSSVWV